MIAAVIPCYRVKRHILGVLAGDSRRGRSHLRGGRRLSRRQRRRGGVGLQRSAREGAAPRSATRASAPRRSPAIAPRSRTAPRVIVRLDGDGQMDPALIPRLVRPIADGEADYAKGNRFFELEGLRAMPPLRLFGNSILSFASKLSSGYWNVFDPTNGFTAIHAAVLRQLPLDKLSRRLVLRVGPAVPARHDPRGRLRRPDPRPLRRRGELAGGAPRGRRVRLEAAVATRRSGSSTATTCATSTSRRSRSRSAFR